MCIEAVDLKNAAPQYKIIPTKVAAAEKLTSTMLFVADLFVNSHSLQSIDV